MEFDEKRGLGTIEVNTTIEKKIRIL